MRAEGAELWAWLQRGAHFYVCGDAQRMAGDVEKAMVEIARSSTAATTNAPPGRSSPV